MGRASEPGSADACERERKLGRLAQPHPGGEALHEQAEAGEQHESGNDARGDRGRDGALLRRGDGE